MDLRRHSRLVLILGLIFCLVVAVHWTVRRDEAADRPAPTERIAIAVDAAVQSPPTTVAEPPSRSAPAARSVALPTGTFRGRVIDAVTREPVREFELEFRRGRAYRPDVPPAGVRLFRAADGRFVWPDVPTGAWTFIARASGYQRFLVREFVVSTSEAPEIVLPLQPGHTLRGRVYDETSHEGIAAARIDFREAHTGRFEGNWRARVHVESQKDGSFILDGVPEGRIILAVYAQKYAAREVDVVVSPKTAPLEIGLSTGGVISGYLAAADGSTPIAGDVGLYHVEQGFGSASRTGEAGEFMFEHLAPGRYRLAGQAGGRSGEREVTVAKGARMDGVVLALSAARSIRGVVTGLRTEELEHVSISVQRDDGASDYFSTVRLDAQRTYAVHGVEPGPVRVVADVDNRRQISKTVDMPADTDLTVNLDFPRGARLSGHVTRAGKPLPEAWLQPRPVVEQDLLIHGGLTLANGEYVIEDVPAGEYYVLVDHYRSRSIQLSGDTVFDIDVPAADLSGRVIEEGRNAPIVGADIDIWPVSPNSPRTRLYDRSDHFGQFALAGIEPGDFVLSAYKPGYEMHRERVSDGSAITEMTIQLRRDRGVEISVHEAGSGAPLERVYANEMIGQHNGSHLQIALDANGVGYIPGALTGSTLSFSAMGYLPAVVRDWNGQALELQLEKQSLTDRRIQ